MSPKRIQELTEKKYRKETGLFIVEGDKNIRELFASDFTIVTLVGTNDFISVMGRTVDAYEERMHVRVEVKEVKENELVKMGTLLSNNAGIAVAKQKEGATLEAALEDAKQNIVLVLDDVRDPGNLGTIMRTADWYGVSYILCSPTTTDAYSPKVIASSMGAYTRIQLLYVDVETVLSSAKETNLPLIVADLEGASTHETALPASGLLIMGSESHGISGTAKTYATHTVMIPRFGKTESLNVGVATAILLDTMRRGS